jgi:hypothetical protein
MSVYYSIYAEVHVGNAWYNISPLIRQLDGTVKVQPVISGQSWLGEAIAKMEENLYKRGLPSDLSEELRKVYHHNDNEKIENFWSDMTYGEYYAQTIFLVNYGKQIKNRVKPNIPSRYRGYVAKHVAAAYEIGDIDEINHWCTTAEYEGLSPTQKKKYVYLEWNNWNDWYAVYSELVSKVDCLLSFFSGWCFYHILDCNEDDRSPSADCVRLIVEKS